MSQRVVEKFFRGWQARYQITPEGVRVTVPSMSQAASEVVADEIRAQSTEVYQLAVTPTGTGGWVFDLAVEERSDKLRGLIGLIRARAEPTLNRCLDAVLGAPEPAEQAAVLAELSLLLENRREFDLALSALSLAQERDQANPRLTYNHAILLLKLGHQEDAASLFEAILVIEPAFEPALYNLAVHHSVRGERARAREYLTHLLSAHPTSMPGHLLAGQLAQEEGKLSQALSVFLRALGLDPQEPEVHYRLSQVYRELEVLDAARSHWNRYRTAVGQVPSHRYLSCRLVLEGEPAGAQVKVDGVVVGPAPRALMDVKPGPHRLCFEIDGRAVEGDVRLVEGCSYVARYGFADPPSISLTEAPLKMTLRDERGRSLTGAELASQMLAQFEPESPPDDDVPGPGRPSTN